MHRRRSNLPLLVTVVLVVLTLLTGVGWLGMRWLGVSPLARFGPAPVTRASSPGPSLFRHYVALGDSYTSGPLIPSQKLEKLGCLRSTANYPSVLAKQLQIPTFTDVSCGGADTTNLTQPQDLTVGRNQPQLDALTPDTDLVTLGIGGNDFGVFGDLTGSCQKLRSTDPTGAPCRRHFTGTGGTDTLRQKVQQTGDRVAAALRAIRQRAPRARILVVGYPRIAPTDRTCPALLPFATGDYGYLDGIEQALDTALSKAAAATGVSYVNTYAASAGHDACATPGNAWINGQNRTHDGAAYHPNAAGMSAEAGLIAHLLTSRAG